MQQLWWASERTRAPRSLTQDAPRRPDADPSPLPALHSVGVQWDHAEGPEEGAVQALW